MKHKLLVLALLSLLFTACKKSPVLNELEQQKQINQKQRTAQNLVLNQLVKTDKVFYDNWNGSSKPFYSRHYYPTNTMNLPVVVISHADGLNQDYKDYDALGFALAAQKMYVISINRKSNGMHSYDGFDELLTAHLKRLYLDKNGQTLPTGPGGDFQIIKPLSKNVMLFGHSAGGRATLYKGKSVIQNLNLNLKAVIGLAPTMNISAPALYNVPFFIIQGTGDTDGGYCRHYEKSTNAFNARAKVPIFEGYSGSSERAYIMLNAAVGHYIEDHTNVVTLTKAIALAYLKNNKTLFNQHIRYQTNKLTSTWVQYWDNGNNEIVYAANPFVQPSTLTPDGVNLSQTMSYYHLNNDPERTSTLHRSSTLKITKNIFQIGTPRASFKVVFPQTMQNKQHLRFRAGQLFDFTQGEAYSNAGIDIRIRLIYKGLLGRKNVSEWAYMSDVCGKVINPHILNCPRNVMTSYVMPLTSFNYSGQTIAGVEFDLGGDFNKTLMIDDIAFTTLSFK